MKDITAVQREGQAASAARLDPSWYPESDRPMLSGESVHYEVSGRTQAIVWGGLGVVRQLVKRLGMAKTLDARVTVLKRHFPYHESDHILNMIYNLVTGGRTLEDLESRRRDVAYLDALGARRIPDPTTAGDFLRRTPPTPRNGGEAARRAIAGRLWAAAVPTDHTPARTYLAGRAVWPPDGIGPGLPASVRWLPRGAVRRDVAADWYDDVPEHTAGAIVYAFRQPGGATFRPSRACRGGD